MDFFGHDAPVKAGREGVMIVRYSDGRASGDALVLFDNDRDLEHAMEKNRQSMGSRYVELYKSTLKEFQMVYTVDMHGVFSGKTSQCIVVGWHWRVNMSWLVVSRVNMSWLVGKHSK